MSPSRLRRSEWDAAIGAAAFQHGWAYGAVAERLGATVRRYEFDEGVGMAQILCRGLGPFRIAYLPMGILWRGEGRDDALPALRRALATHGYTLLVSPGPVARYSPTLAGPRDMAVLDISPDAGARRAGMAKKWRNRLGHAERAELAIETSGDIPDWLITRERKQQRARRYGNLPRRWIAAWMQVAPTACLTLAARDARGEAIAAMAFITHGAAATYLLGWSGPEGRRVSAHNLLLARAADILHDRGIRRLDLGQIDRSSQAGLTRFKLGAGAGIVTVPPCRAIGSWSRDRAVAPCGQMRPGTN